MMLKILYFAPCVGEVLETPTTKATELVTRYKPCEYRVYNHKL